MTLTNTTNRVQYSGDGSTTSFAVSFVFWDLDDPQLVHADADGVETIWVRGTHFTMAGGDGATGTVTVITSPTDYTPASSTTLTIRSNIANTQPTSLPFGGDLSSGGLEQQLDQIVRQLQQFSETVGRSLKFKTSSPEVDVTLNDLDGNAAKYMQVNTAEDGFTYSTALSAGSITDPVPIANGGTGSTSAPAALTALGAQADLAVPSQSEAETGTATTERVWTAQRVQQAIADLTLNTVSTWTAAQRGLITLLSDGSTITVNFADSNHYSVTLGGNRTLANPTNLVVGQSGSIFVSQDGSGSRTLSYGSVWDFPGGTAPTLTTTASAVDRLDYLVRTSTSIHAVLSADVK